ncbi:transposase [Mycobacterium sp. Lab-001]|uniref:transposase n=1 Tax=Mycobacterium sp. Lab-001 TaxID=3410136 RepID=UPI003D187096
MRRSANRNKTRQALAKLRATQRHRRQDFCAQTAHRLAQSNAVVVLEDLQTRNMTRRAAPVEYPDKPGQFLPIDLFRVGVDIQVHLDLFGPAPGPPFATTVVVATMAFT